MFCTLQAAVRSSRRKRNQYVVDLRDLVCDLKRRRQDAMTQNELLQQLTCLWERLCTEVEAEIQDGVRQQLNFNIPSFEETMNTARKISAAENQEINFKLNSLRRKAATTVKSQAVVDDSDDERTTDDIMTNLLFGNNTVAEEMLQFETSDDRGAMEL